jgi:hypothetical protein
MMTKAPVKASAICRSRQRHQVLDGKKRQERSREKFQHAGDDPTGTGRQIGDPPCRLPAFLARRQKPQEVDLLADLRDQREHHGRGGAEQHDVKRVPLFAGKAREIRPALK